MSPPQLQSSANAFTIQLHTSLMSVGMNVGCYPPLGITMGRAITFCPRVHQPPCYDNALASTMTSDRQQPTTSFIRSDSTDAQYDRNLQRHHAVRGHTFNTASTSRNWLPSTNDESGVLRSTNVQGARPHPRTFAFEQSVMMATTHQQAHNLCV